MPPNQTTKQFLGAYKKGRKAAKEGKSYQKCPYRDYRAGRFDHIITFSRAFIRFWRKGFEDEKAGKPDSYVCK